MPIEFVAEVKKVSSRKTASLDIEHQVTFAGEDMTISELSKLPADCLVKVTCEVVQ
jgi:hypothetical protein